MEKTEILEMLLLLFFESNDDIEGLLKVYAFGVKNGENKKSK